MALEVGGLIYRRQLRKGWTRKGRPLHTGVTWKGKGAESCGRHSWPVTTSYPGGQRDRPCLHYPSLFPERKFEIGTLEKGSMEPGGEGKEAVQRMHKVKWFCVRKGRHK